MFGITLHFLRPWLLLAILPTALLWWQLWRQHFQSQSSWHKVIDPQLLPYLFQSEKHTQQKSWGWSLLGFGWLIAIIAISGPSWKQHNIPVSKHGVASIIVLDLSPTILATDLPPTRLTRARYKIRDLLAIPEGEMGLIVYAGEPYVVSPITEDHKTIAAFLNNLTPTIMPVAGQDISAALHKAKLLLTQNNNTSGDIILMSSSNNVPQTAIDTAEKLHDEGFTTTVLGLGTAQGGPLKLEDGKYFKNNRGNILISHLDVAGLKKLAAAGGGNYIPFTNDSQDVDLIKQRLLRKHYQAKQQTAQSQHIIRWHDQGYILVWLLLPLMLLGFRHGCLEKYLG